ncbi:Ribonuclease H2 subunit A [Zea mays]|uniref:Ribonuclease H2 subunit A n=1 Tax=Zea mays TaxID=4577 RepID=A0A3L6G6X1_MAIZE|nr:Ribonuclease H2 subunit A [Zea mays]
MRNGSGYPRDPDTKRWLEDHKHLVFGFFKDAVAVTWESDEVDQEETDSGDTKEFIGSVVSPTTGFRKMLSPTL